MARILAVAIGAGLLAAAAWLGGFLTALVVVPQAAVVPDDVLAPENFAVFSEVWDIIGEEYYGAQPAPEAVTRALVRGLVENLADPYAEFRTAAEFGEFTHDAPPDVADGIGAWIEPAPEGARVVSTLPGSPARQAGLHPGVLLLGVDGEPVAGISRHALLTKLGGLPGSEVTLRILSTEGPADVELVRTDPERPLVETRQLGGGAAYLRIGHFEHGAVRDFETALERLAADGDTTALVLDLRDNPGGDLDALRHIASRFVEGPLWIERRRETEVTVRSVAGHAVTAFDSITVVVNDGTAAAAEILAGVLRETSGASLVGKQTFGNPTVQGLVRFTDGSAMRLSLATWTTPGGVDVTKSGLIPDRTVVDEANQLSVATDHALGRSSGG